ncbi:MAG: type II toxin-antitoxin system VapC family toxin [Intrasporangium sp.]|uniref:type II toxin-antitoxin system VapC family toxin n=1 Tax=Intrasporangium sp. TaxID=1925024 RepID=UPI002647CD92|nr:type II toxin-antitoxin system VapC family toxin [Intrasporangium sp.]MDN5797926.1 type II toxin-antitoxin system VapC family toxin [Intrasporangium sp.]
MTGGVPPPERAILDTSVVLAEGIAPLPGVLAVSAITLAELHFGVLVAQTAAIRAERLRRLSLLQHHFDALPVDEAVSVSYGRLAAAVVEAGRQPRRRVMDLLIAATAHAHGARLYTRNPADFAGIEGLVEVVAL